MSECFVCGADTEICEAHAGLREMRAAGERLAAVAQEVWEDLNSEPYYLTDEDALRAALKAWREVNG